MPKVFDKGNEWCIVPMCTNTRRNNANKIFIRVPNDAKRRRLWLLATRRDPTKLSAKSVLFVCEDHFNLEEDMANFMQFKLTGCLKRMKNDIVPHKFDCQTDRKLTHSKPERAVVVKRRKIEVLNEVLQPTSETQLADASTTTTTEIYQSDEIDNIEPPHESKTFKDVAIQIRPSYRSKSVQCNIMEYEITHDKDKFKFKYTSNSSTNSSSSKNEKSSFVSESVIYTSDKSSDKFHDGLEEENINMKNISYSDFKNICRMCMLSCDIKFVQDNTISDVFYKLTDIHFDTNDELPQQICLKCFEKINEIHEFAFKCKQTHVSLLKCINDFKNALIHEEQETLAGINKPIKTEEEITIDEHEIDFIKDEVLNSVSEYDIDELKLKEDNNIELERYMIPGTSNDHDQNINCSEDVIFNQNREQNTPNIKVENEEESNDNVNLNDSKEDTYSSDISDTSYIDSAENNEDLSKEIKDKHYKCGTCNRTFISFTLFNKHKSSTSCKRPNKCEQCSKSYVRSFDLKRHMRTHSDERPFKCEQCFKSFLQSSYLVNHMRTHSGERPYKCEQCLKTFSQSGNFKAHVRKHSGERPFKCEACLKSFTRSYHLRRHMRTHSGEPPFKCKQCFNSFSYLSRLKEHMRIHSGERPFKCETCLKSFTRSYDLKRHMRTHLC